MEMIHGYKRFMFIMHEMPSLPVVFFAAILLAVFALACTRAAPIINNIAYRRRLKRSGLDEIAGGQEFEQYMVYLLRKNDYKNVQTTPKTGDYGADVLAERDGERFAIQCKLYNKSVGVKAVQEVFSAMQFYGCDAAVVATNSRFSRNAVNLAESTGVILWGRDDLVEMSRRR